MTTADRLLDVSAAVAGYGQPVAGPLSFVLNRGEVVGLAGPNGSGKTTFLRAIGGDAQVFAGAIARRDGLRVSHHRQQEDGIEEVPFCGHELLALTGATARGLPDWLHDSLAPRLDALSGGQRQFIRLWACLAAPADLVLLDEPTNNLDRRGCEFLAAHLRELAADRGILLVSHDAVFIHAVCDRVVTMP